MVKFYCMNCKFRYTPKNPQRIDPPSICPNCGKNDVMLAEGGSQKKV